MKKYFIVFGILYNDENIYMGTVETGICVDIYPNLRELRKNILNDTENIPTNKPKPKTVCFTSISEISEKEYFVNFQ